MRVMIDRVRGHSFIGTLIPQGGQIIDLGMNEGNFACDMQQKYKCAVLGVEANPTLVPKIASSATLRPLNYAVSQFEGELSFYIDPNNSEASSLTPPEGDCTKVVIPSITLPALLAFGGVEQIDLLKIDIEGAEIPLLLNTPAETLLKAKQICVEFHAFLGHDSFHDIQGVIARMDEIGFDAIDFSRRYEDVLFINRQSIRLRQSDKLLLKLDKYRLGLKRMVRRRLSRPAA